MMQWGWMTAGFAAVTALWGQLQAIFARISSHIVVTVDVDTGSATENVAGYLWDRYRRSPFGVRRFTMMSTFIKPSNRFGVVGHEMPGAAITFFNGWRPLFASIRIDQNGQFTGGLRLTFLRGTFDIEKIIYESAAQRNANTYGLTKSRNRYRIIKMFGYNGQERKENSSSGEASLSEKEETNTDINPFYRPIGYDKKDLGRPASDSPFSALAYSDDILNFIEEIRGWLGDKDWYLRRSIPWRLGGLLTGLPGTGKSSFCRAIAQEFDLPIYVIDLSTMDNRELTACWKRIVSNGPCIALFEDIDRIFDGDRNLKAKDNIGHVTMDCLLNCLSGVEEANGVLTILTANDASRLDSALLRDGRVDCVLTFGLPNDAGRRKIADIILSDCPQHIDRTVIDGDGDTGAHFVKRCGKIAVREKKMIKNNGLEINELISSDINKKLVSNETDA